MDSDGFDYNALHNVTGTDELTVSRESLAEDTQNKKCANDQSNNHPSKGSNPFKFMRVPKPVIDRTTKSDTLAHPFHFQHQQRLHDSVSRSPAHISPFANIFKSLSATPGSTFGRTRQRTRKQDSQDDHFTFRQTQNYANYVPEISEKTAYMSLEKLPSLLHKSRLRSSTPISTNEPDIPMINRQDTSDVTLVDSQDTDHDPIQEIKRLYTELAEHNRRSEQLHTQIFTLNSTNSSLKRAYEDKAREYDKLREEFTSTSARLASVQVELHAAVESRRSTVEKYETKATEVKVLSEDLQSVKAQLALAHANLEDSAINLTEERKEKETTKAHLIKTKQCFADLEQSYAIIQSSLADLRTSYDEVQTIYKAKTKELKELRLWAGEGLESIRPILDLHGRCDYTMQMKAVIQEMQEELNNSHRVTDLLRDKLHHLASQLAESQNKVKELEQVKCSIWLDQLQELKVSAGKISSLEQTEKKVEAVVECLIKREKEVFDALAMASGLETKLVATEALLQEARAVAEDWKNKQESAKAENEKISEQLLNSKDRIWKQDQEILQLRTEIGTLQESKAEMRLLIMEAKKDLADREAVLKEAQERIPQLEAGTALLRTQLADLTVLKQKADERVLDVSNLLQAREIEIEVSKGIIEDHTATIENLRNSLGESETLAQELQVKLGKLTLEKDLAIAKQEGVKDEVAWLRRETEKTASQSQTDMCNLREELLNLKIRECAMIERSQALDNSVALLKSKLCSEEERSLQANNTVLVLQERLDAQTITLRLSKEQCGDLQEQLTASECSFATKLEAVNGTLKAEIAVLQERNSSLQNLLDALRQDSGTRNEALSAITLELEKKLANSERDSQRLVKEYEKRIIAAEEITAVMKTRVNGLEESLVAKDKTLEVLQKTSENNENAEAQLLLLRGELKEMEEKHRQHLTKDATLMNRYRSGELTDDEKNFVNYLIQLTQSIYENDIVMKDNELRRQENLVATHRSRVEELEATLARLLKEKKEETGLEANTMVDLNLWMLESPNDMLHNLPEQPSPVDISSNLAEKQHRDKTCSTGVPVTFTRLLEDSDPDDDSPLSILSSVVRGTSLKKHGRAPTPEQVEEPVRSKRRLRQIPPTTQKSQNGRKKAGLGDVPVKDRQKKRKT